NIAHIGRHTHFERGNHNAMLVRQGYRREQLKSESAFAVGGHASDDYELTVPQSQMRVEGQKPRLVGHGLANVGIIAQPIEALHRIGLRASYCIADSRLTLRPKNVPQILRALRVRNSRASSGTEAASELGVELLARFVSVATKDNLGYIL